MGRAIVREPEAFLMDEPLSNLDAKLRVQMRAEIHQLQRRLDVTTIYVTHDQVEAMTMGDRVAVMSAGRLQQVDTPQVLYDQPVNEFVAGFIGSPAINLVEAQLAQTNGQPLGQLRRAHAGRSTNAPRATAHGLKDYVGKDDHPRHPARGLRGREHRDGRSERPAHEGDVRPDGAARRRGARLLQHEATGVVSSAVEADARRGRGRPARRDEDDDASKTRLCARVSPRTQHRGGQPAELAVDTSRLYFFDPQTREAI